MPSSLPLDGIRVVALEHYLAGNHGSFLMSLLGAEVIKVERPGAPDVLRGVGPFVGDGQDRRSGGELRMMGNKKSIVLDLSTEGGRTALFDLVERSDVFWTNQKPSTLARFGIEFASLVRRQPRVVYATLSGFGHSDLYPEGPMSDRPAFDIIAQGLAGLQFRSGEEDGPPGYNGLALGDEITSTLAVLGVVSALLRRERDDEPQRVDVAMHDAMVFVNEYAIGSLSTLGVVPPRGRSGTSAPYGPYKTADGWVNIGVGGDPVWRRFCQAIDRPDLLSDSRFDHAYDRVSRNVELDPIVQGWTATRATAEVVARLSSFDVPCAPVFDIPDVLAGEQIRSRNMLLTVDDPVAGSVEVVGNPIKLNGPDPTKVSPPPVPGQDTVEILQTILDYSAERIEELASAGGVVLAPGSEDIVRQGT